MKLDAQSMRGHVLTRVSSSWHVFQGERSSEPTHVWLHVADIGAVRLHTLNGLVISVDEVYEPADMGDFGQLVIDDSDGSTALAERVGERITAVTELVQRPPSMTVGIALQLSGGAVGIADLGDQLVIAPWPTEDWKRWGVRSKRRRLRSLFSTFNAR